MLAAAALAAMGIAGWRTSPCAAIEGPALKTGSRLTLVTPGEPSEVIKAAVTERISKCDAFDPGEVPGTHYSITLFSQPKDHIRGVWIAFAGDVEARTRVPGVPLIRLSASIPAARVRSCATLETMHYTLWEGEPLKSKRLWHFGLYVGYDLEANCSAADFR